MARSVAHLFVALATLVPLACAPAAAPLVRAPEVAAASPAIPAAPPMQAPPAPEVVQASEEDAAIPISSSDPTWGSRTAPVTLVLFSDFQCPFCARLEPTLDDIKAKYGAAIRIVWKNNPLPFHPNAKPAAEAGAGVMELAGPDAFWRFHDFAFKNQSALSPQSYEQWATASGVDLSEFREGMAAHRWAEKVNRDLAVAARVGVNGTPATFVNGTLVSGSQPIDKFTVIIDAELTKAALALDRGVPRDRVYLTLAGDNFNTKPPAAATPDRKPDDSATVFKVPLGRAPARGKATALVTLIEFADFQCPYCARVEPTLEQLRHDYGDKLRIVWRDQPLPFHPRAEPAAEMAREAYREGGTAMFWKTHDALFASQPKLEDADLDAIATTVGLDLAKVHHAIEQHVYKTQIDEDTNLASDFSASGTPHFFINGRRLVGAQPVERFKAIIDEEIHRAETLLAAHTSAARLYDELIKDGKGPPEPETRQLAPRAGAPTKGSASARVVIEEIGDFQCPFCKRAEDTVADVLQHNGAHVRLVWRNYPLPMHPDAPLAAEAAMEAFQQQGAAGFWKMHDLLFANQPSGGTTDGLKRPALDQYAQQLGLDMNRWAAALDGHTHAAEIDADVAAAKAAGITGTPAFVIGGYYLGGAQPAAKFQRIIDRVLASGPARPASASSPSAAHPH
jgi:protein-disulfide isomerase